MNMFRRNTSISISKHHSWNNTRIEQPRNVIQYKSDIVKKNITSTNMFKTATDGSLLLHEASVRRTVFQHKFHFSTSRLIQSPRSMHDAPLSADPQAVRKGTNITRKSLLTCVLHTTSLTSFRIFQSYNFPSWLLLFFAATNFSRAFITLLHFQ